MNVTEITREIDLLHDRLSELAEGRRADRETERADMAALDEAVASLLTARDALAALEIPAPETDLKGASVTSDRGAPYNPWGTIAEP